MGEAGFGEGARGGEEGPEVGRGRGEQGHGNGHLGRRCSSSGGSAAFLTVSGTRRETEKTKKKERKGKSERTWHGKLR